jgi:hypothetical protein
MPVTPHLEPGCPARSEWLSPVTTPSIDAPDIPCIDGCQLASERCAPPLRATPGLTETLVDRLVGSARLGISRVKRRRL